MAELVDFTMFLMAGAIFQESSHQKHDYYHATQGWAKVRTTKSVSNKVGHLRRDVKNSLKVVPSWPGKTRLEILKANLRMHDSEATEDGRESIKDLIQLFNRSSENVVEISGVPAADQILRDCATTSENMPDISEDSVLFNHLCYVNLGYMPKLSMAKMSAEIERIKNPSDRHVNKPIKGLFSGTRAAVGSSEKSDSLRADSLDEARFSADHTVALLRLLSSKGIPYVGKVHERLMGNFPKFARDTRKPRVRRLFVYRMAGEPVFLHVLYDQWNRPPALYLSNFHTNTLSYLLHSPPLITVYHNSFVGAVDPSLTPLSRQVKQSRDRWALKCIEDVLSFLTNNARVAFALKNPEQVPVLSRYTARHFFMDVLKEHFPPVDPAIVFDRLHIQPFVKLKNRSKRCWKKDCSKTEVDRCRNRDCGRPVCTVHQGFICLVCAGPDFYDSGVPTNYPAKLPGQKRARCRVVGCPSVTRQICGNQPCLRPTCAQHGAILCYSCLFLTSKLRDKICANCVPILDRS